MREENEVVECLLEDGHSGDHLCKLLSGIYMIWLPDPDCDCGEECCESYVWGEISKENAALLISNKPRSS